MPTEADNMSPAELSQFLSHLHGDERLSFLVSSPALNSLSIPRQYPDKEDLSWLILLFSDDTRCRRKESAPACCCCWPDRFDSSPSPTRTRESVSSTRCSCFHSLGNFSFLFQQTFRISFSVDKFPASSHSSLRGAGPIPPSPHTTGLTGCFWSHPNSSCHSQVSLFLVFLLSAFLPCLSSFLRKLPHLFPSKSRSLKLCGFFSSFSSANLIVSGLNSLAIDLANRSPPAARLSTGFSLFVLLLVPVL